MSKNYLTVRQAVVFHAIKRCIESEGTTPTRKELAESLGISVNAVEEHIKTLARKQYVTLIPGTTRNIRLADTSVGMPVISELKSAGVITDPCNVESYCGTVSKMFWPYADYLLRMPDDMMMLASIRAGDLVAVHATTKVRNRQIVVVRVEGQLLVRRAVRSGNSASLKLTAYPTPEAGLGVEPFTEVDTRDHRVQVEGVMVGLVRRE